MTQNLRFPCAEQPSQSAMGELDQLQRASKGFGETDVFQMPLLNSHAGPKCCDLGRLEKGVSRSFYERVFFFHPVVLSLL